MGGEECRRHLGGGEAGRPESGPHSFIHRNQKTEPLCNVFGGKTFPELRLFIAFYLSPLGVNIHGSPCRGINVPDGRNQLDLTAMLHTRGMYKPGAGTLSPSSTLKPSEL